MVLVFAWVIALISGGINSISEITVKNLCFLIVSGFFTGASWLCYFRALQTGDVNKVVPVDKSSTILTVILAFIILGEPISWFHGICVAFMAVGIYLMIEKKSDDGDKEVKKTWLIYAVLSAVFAALTSILGKIGITDVESNAGTMIRTAVVLVMSWLMVFVTGKGGELRDISPKELTFICLSGVATGASWLCYYKALQDGLASVVVPIDKLSILITVAFSYFVFGERLSRKAVLGLIMMVAGTLAMLINI